MGLDDAALPVNETLRASLTRRHCGFPQSIGANFGIR